MLYWPVKFFVSYLVAMLVAAGLLFGIPQLSAMCSNKMSWLDCKNQMNFSEVFFTPTLPIFLLFIVSVSFVLTLIWPRILAWHQALAIGIICGGLVALEFSSGILHDLDVSLEMRFGSVSSLILYVVFLCFPYIVSLVSFSIFSQKHT